MLKQLMKKAIRKSRGVVKFFLSRRCIPMLKGTLAYILAFVLIFSKRFDDRSNYPLALSSMMIVVIASGPGKSIGACLQSTGLVVFGVSLGCIGFVILAKLAPWPVAQGVVFAIMVYGIALVKSRGIKWFGFSLLFILMSFNGIYTTYLLGVFNHKYLIAYYAAYLWGAAIVLAVNWLVFPKSSEKELRHTLVTSLEHIGTFAHLLAKAYTLESTAQEQSAREHLIQTIRADFGFLSEKIEETTIEINYSRFSLKDYQCMVARTRGLQQALITAHSSLAGVKEQDMRLFKERFLPETLMAFSRLRRAVDLTIREIGNELGSRPMVIPSTQSCYDNYMDLDRTSASVTSDNSNEPTLAASVAEGNLPDEEEVSNRLSLIGQRLAAEVEIATWSPTREASPAPGLPKANASTDGTEAESPKNDSPGIGSTGRPLSSAAEAFHGQRCDDPQVKSECGMQRLRREFDAFATAQHDLLQESLIGNQVPGAGEKELKLHKPMASLRETFGTDGITSNAGDGKALPAATVRHWTQSNEKDAGNVESSKDLEDDEKVLKDGHSLIRVWGFLFALDQFVSQLEVLWTNVRQTGSRRRKRLHVHLFELLKRPHQKSKAEDEDADLPLPEALALLEKRTYEPVKPNFWQRLDLIHHGIQSPTSIFALKTAAAASVYTTLIYATKSRSWFISYGLTSGLLTIVVAITPTLGQSILSFVTQIAGSGIGYLWGLAVLEMFRNVGGYHFNPFGMVCMLLPYALILQYVFYEQPAYFIVALLGMNGTGVLIVTEWVAVEYLHRLKFDQPTLRTGKALTGLAIALAIAAIFQLFILRNPARRRLRQSVAGLTYDLLSYAVLLQAFGLAVLSSSPENRPSKPALLRVERELKHRELKLQSAIINMAPLVKFAAAEPQFSSPFRKDVILRITRSNQLVLDRLREARAALGTQEFEEFILTHFLYLIASSLSAKAPLPHFTPLSALTTRDRAEFVHDCLVLSARFAQTEEGKTSIGTHEFMRYVSFLLCSVAVIEPIKIMEDASKELFGELESKLL